MIRPGAHGNFVKGIALTASHHRLRRQCFLTWATMVRVIPQVFMGIGVVLYVLNVFATLQH